jgi:hypothetical protein
VAAADAQYTVLRPAVAGGENATGTVTPGERAAVDRLLARVTLER